MARPVACSKEKEDIEWWIVSERGAGPHELQREGAHIEVWSVVPVLTGSREKGLTRGVKRGAGPHELQREGTHIEMWSAVLVLMSSKEKKRNNAEKSPGSAVA